MTPDKPSASEARELLSCPFCGGSDLVLDENSYKTKWVICDGCGAQIDDSPHGDCVDLWNTRASPAPQGGEREKGGEVSEAVSVQGMRQAALMIARGTGKENAQWVYRAADEIERLRSELDQARAWEKKAKGAFELLNRIIHFPFRSDDAHAIRNIAKEAYACLLPVASTDDRGDAK